MTRADLLRLSPASICICIGDEERKDEVSVSQNKINFGGGSAMPPASLR
jgi:hypothetical protein